jgi:DNA-binding MarR family transcriptional regulator
MEQLRKYLFTLLGNEITIDIVNKDELATLPYHITNAFYFHTTRLYGKKLLLLKIKNTDFQIGQIKKQLDQITKVFKEPVVLVTDTMHPMNKKRLIENGIQFIVPEKQLFLPGLLVDLKEDLPRRGYLRRTEKLTPSAQFILLYQILHRYEKLERFTFKELAKKLGYTAMGVTKAIAVLEQLELCKVEGKKEKYIHFNERLNELWEAAKPYLINPVLKTVFVDELPKTTVLQSNVMALTEYTNMAPGNQKYYAIEKTNFYALQKNNELVNPNEYEGKYCLEVWKYNPNTLAENVTEECNVDPLSLFLSLKDQQDERIEMALDQIIEKFIW